VGRRFIHHIIFFHHPNKPPPPPPPQTTGTGTYHAMTMMNDKDSIY
jgi:hypothetical protein